MSCMWSGDVYKRQEEAFAIAVKDEKIVPLLEGKTIVKEIYVPNKIVNLVVK